MWSEYFEMIDFSFQRREELVLAFAQVQRDVVPRCGALDRLDLEVAGAVAISSARPRSAGSAGAARFDRDLVGDDEARIEADAELADQLRVLLLVALQLPTELPRAALGDRAEVGDRFLAATCRCRCR